MIGFKEPERDTAQMILCGVVLGALALCFITLIVSYPLRLLIEGPVSCRGEVCVFGWRIAGYRASGAIVYEAVGGGLGISWVTEVAAWLGLGSDASYVSLIDAPFEWIGMLAWIMIGQPIVRGDIAAMPWALLPFLPLALIPLGIVHMDLIHRMRRVSLGKAHWARRRDMRANGWLDRTGIVLGQLDDGTLVRTYETLSALQLAPPGTGKSAGSIIPNLIANWPDDYLIRGGRGKRLPGPSFIVNDPKGDLYRDTGGHRSTVGPVFRLAWASQNGDRWNPLSLLSMPGGRRVQQLRAMLVTLFKGYYRNPLAAIAALLTLQRDNGSIWRTLLQQDPRRLGDFDLPQKVFSAEQIAASAAQFYTQARLDAIERILIELGSLYSDREQLLDMYATVLIPESVEIHWRTTGREFLGGMMAFTICRAELAGMTAVAGSSAGEPSFGAALDWLQGAEPEGGWAELRVIPGSGGEGDQKVPDKLSVPSSVNNADIGKGDSEENDAIAQILKAAIAEAKQNGYPARVIQDLNATLQKSSKERSSVVSTAAGSIALFKNAAVRQSTSTCDFALDDLRGMFRSAENPLGKPITVYIDVPLQSAATLGRITGLFVEAAASFLISQKEDTFKNNNGRPVGILADEFWTLGQLEIIPQIPALGRGQWVWLVAVGQSFGQIEKIYGREGAQIMLDAISYKEFLTQSSEEAAKRISDGIGNRTEIKHSGSGGLAAWFDKNARDTLSAEGLPLISAQDVRSMPKLDPPNGKRGSKIVQINGYGHMPILCLPAAKHIPAKGLIFDKTFGDRIKLPIRSRGTHDPDSLEFEDAV